MKKADTIRLLQAMAEISKGCAADLERDPQNGDLELAQRLRGEASGLENAVMVLTRPHYAKRLWAIYFPEEVTQHEQHE